MNPNIEIKKQPKSRVEITVSVPAQDFDSCVEQAILDLGKDVELQGFRKGAAPRKLLEAALGERQILDRASTIAVNLSYFKALTENKINAIGNPEIKITKVARNNPLEFIAEVAVLPEIVLPDYKPIIAQVKKNPVFVEDKEMEESLKWLQSSLAKFSLKEGQAQNGDWVEIEMQINSEPEVQDAFILGKGRLTEEIEKNIVGMPAGQDKEFDFAFPKGEKAKCRIKVKAIKKVELPEIDDAFAKMVGPFETLEMLKKRVKEDIENGKINQEKERVINEAVSKVAQQVDIDIPDVLIEREVEAALHDSAHRIQEELQMTFEEYLEKIGKTQEEIKKNMRPDAERKIKSYLVLKEMQKKEKIEATEEEIKKELEKMEQEYPEIKEKKGEFDQGRLLEYTKERIENRRVFEKIEEYLGK